jgi:hypothetical protein
MVEDISECTPFTQSEAKYLLGGEAHKNNSLRVTGQLPFAKIWGKSRKY